MSFPINGSLELPNISSHELPGYGSYELPEFGSLELLVYGSSDLPDNWLSRASCYMAHMSFQLRGSKEFPNYMLIWAYLYMN